MTFSSCSLDIPDVLYIMSGKKKIYEIQLYQEQWPEARKNLISKYV